MVKFSDMSRGQFAGMAVAGVVFITGMVTIVKVGLTFLPKPVPTMVGAKPAAAKRAAGDITTIENASFSYLVPGSGADWAYDGKRTAYDRTKGVVQYQLSMKQGNTSIIVSQQVMPAQLQPKGSDTFNKFIRDQRAVRSQPVGRGTLYYLPALVNGASVSDGSDTIIFATDNILMFARAGAVLKSALWAELIASMHAAASN